MTKNIDLEQWVVNELQELADADKRPLKNHIELLLEKIAKRNMAAKRKIKKHKTQKQ